MLASDEFQGRAPGGPAEQKTIDYIAGQFKALGLQPAGKDGGWTQAVHLIRTKVQDAAQLRFSTPSGTLQLRQGDETMVMTLRPVDQARIAAAPVVFVGYGVHAPERGWDDFKGVDLRGKVAVFLIGDPDLEAQPGEPAYGKFGGAAATYYARWTYKFEEAARRGAIAALIVHEPLGAGYGWSTVKASNGEGYDIVRAHPAKDKVLVQGWLQRAAAADLFSRAGLDFEALKIRARSDDFKPVVLQGTRLSAQYAVRTDHLLSHNVIARLPGTVHPEETILYAAHWDAYGVGAPDAQGRTLRAGAADDAIGVAAVIEAARVFKAGPPPARSILFAAWTAEERGLLWSPDWDLRGAAADVGLTVEIGRDLASGRRWPDWKADSEFKPIRARTAAARH